MDRKITRQAARSYFGTVAVGYCEAQSLLNGLYRFGYNSGVYGWNFDAFTLPGGATICTGYRNMPGANVSKVVRPFEKKAREVLEQNAPNGWKFERLAELRFEFVEELSRLHYIR